MLYTAIYYTIHIFVIPSQISDMHYYYNMHFSTFTFNGSHEL